METKDQIDNLLSILNDLKINLHDNDLIKKREIRCLEIRIEMLERGIRMIWGKIDETDKKFHEIKKQIDLLQPEDEEENKDCNCNCHE